MALELDAVSSANSANLYCVPYFSKGRISENVLEEMLLDLDEDEVVSIIFLMTNNSTDISSVIKALKEDCKTRFFEITKEKDWGEKLLEALIIIENINVLIRLYFTKEEIEEMKIRYCYNIHNVSQNINRVIKSLYFLCKELTSSQVKKLVSEVYKDLQKPVLLLSEEKNLLEIYMLDWLKKKYISFDIDNPNKLNKFIKILKINGLLSPLSFDFESWKLRNENQQDSSHVSGQLFHLVSGTNTVNGTDCRQFSWKIKNHKRLCIIINEVDFIDKSRYKTRKGSDFDSATICATFRGMGFEISSRRNVTAEQMHQLLNSLNKKPFNYAAIFLCILSHGEDGEVIFSDDKHLTVKEIRQKLCCRNLKNVFKFIILQSCQGKNFGVIDKKLTFDSPVQRENERPIAEDKSCIYERHFGLFQATVNEYAAVRHETEGTWFVQDACDELRKTTPISATDWTTNVKRRVNDRKAETNSENAYIVQVPCLKESTIYVDYEFPKYTYNP